MQEKDFMQTGGTITGVVKDGNGTPLEGTTITLKGTSFHAVTNRMGEFALKNIPAGAYELVVTYVSYQDYTEKVIVSDKPLKLYIGLKSLNKAMDELVVRGYYTMNKLLNTGNVSSVKAEDIEKQPVNNPILALEGQVPGMAITQQSGVSGGAVSVQIRGLNTIGTNTDPLYIIDGVPYSSTLYPSSTNQGLAAQSLAGSMNPLSFINPLDIESIEVLKDADATAIYGSRAANGVVLISTKKGKEGAMRIDINGQTGFGTIARKAKLMNTQQYLAMRKQAFANDGITPSAANAQDLVTYSQTSYTDWQNEMIGGTAQYTNLQATISGGSNNVQYLIGGDFHKETTVFPGSWGDKKGSIHFSINSNSANRKFKAGLSGSYLLDDNRLPAVDFTNNILLTPNAPDIFLSNGKLNWAGYPYNPLSSIFSKYRAGSNNLISHLSLSYEILPGLEVKSSFGYNFTRLYENTQTYLESYNPKYNITTTSAGFNNNTTTSWIVEPQISYQASIGKGMLNVLAGSTLQHRDASGQTIIGTGYLSDALLNSLASATGIFPLGSVYEQYRYASVFGRVGYQWDQKYVLNLTGRRDGSSRFGPGRQYGNFGAIGAAWVFSNERLIKDNFPLLSLGKLRGSYGTTGNEPGNSYQYLEFYQFFNSNSYENAQSLQPINLPAPTYQWEVDKKLEAGLELGFFNNRVNLTASIYRNRSGNQIVGFPLPIITGFGSRIGNLDAVIQNTGAEFTLSTINLASKNFKWTTNFNISRNRNKLVSFPGFQDNVEYSQTFIIGKPLTYNRVIRSAGIDPNTGIYQFYDKDGHLTFTPINGIDNNRLMVTTPMYYGGFENKLEYKGIELDITLQFIEQIGQNYLYSLGLPGRYSILNASNLPLPYTNTWTSKNTKAPLEQLTTGFGTPAGLAYASATYSDLAYTDASFIRCKNISVSYNLPANFLRKTGMAGMRIYVLAQNLFTISGYKGVDPESQSLTVLPPLRIVTGGLQIKF